MYTGIQFINCRNADYYQQRIRGASQRVVAHRMRVSLSHKILDFICQHLSHATCIASSMIYSTQDSSSPSTSASTGPALIPNASIKSEASDSPQLIELKPVLSAATAADASLSDSSSRPRMERFRRPPRDEDSSPEPGSASLQVLVRLFLARAVFCVLIITQISFFCSSTDAADYFHSRN